MAGCYATISQRRSPAGALLGPTFGSLLARWRLAYARHLRQPPDLLRGAVAGGVGSLI